MIFVRIAQFGMTVPDSFKSARSTAVSRSCLRTPHQLRIVERNGEFSSLVCYGMGYDTQRSTRKQGLNMQLATSTCYLAHAGLGHVPVVHTPGAQPRRKQFWAQGIEGIEAQTQVMVAAHSWARRLHAKRAVANVKELCVFRGFAAVRAVGL